MVLQVDVPPELIAGDVAEGYGPVADPTEWLRPSTGSCPPAREAGARHGYHGISQGWYEGAR